MKANIGFALRSTLPAKTCLDLAVEAENAGYSSIWVTEGSAGKDAFTLMAALSQQTKTVSIASGIVPIYLRTPALTAMSIAAIDELSNQRAILGLGISHSYIVEEIHGSKILSPLEKIREYVGIIRKALTDPQFNLRGGTYAAGTHFVPVRSTIPIYLAVLRSKMAQLAGNIADGVLLNMIPLSYIPQIVQKVKDGAQEAGKSVSDVKIASYLIATVDDSTDKAAHSIKLQIARYVWMPNYRRMFVAAGYGDTIDKIAADVENHDLEKAAGKIPDKMAEDIGMFGQPDNCNSRLKNFIEAGIDTPIIFPVVPVEEPPTTHLTKLIKGFSPV